MGRLIVLTERYKKQKGNGDLPVKIVVSFLASQKGFEPPTLRLGGRTYPLEGVCNIRFLRKIRIFRDFRAKNNLFSVTFADFTASPERVAPRRVPKMAPFIQKRTKLLFRRRVARVFFCFYDRNIINQKRFSKYPLEIKFAIKIELTIRSVLTIIDNTKISALAVN